MGDVCFAALGIPPAAASQRDSRCGGAAGGCTAGLCCCASTELQGAVVRASLCCRAPFLPLRILPSRHFRQGHWGVALSRAARNTVVAGHGGGRHQDLDGPLPGALQAACYWRLLLLLAAAAATAAVADADADADAAADAAAASCTAQIRCALKQAALLACWRSPRCLLLSAQFNRCFCLPAAGQLCPEAGGPASRRRRRRKGPRRRQP